MDRQVIIAGGGLAGSEAAWQLAERGVPVTLYEMRPARTTPAHKTGRLAELVCSNSLKSNTPGSASWLLKEELRRAGSLLLRGTVVGGVPDQVPSLALRQRCDLSDQEGGPGEEGGTNDQEQHPISL